YPIDDFLRHTCRSKQSIPSLNKISGVSLCKGRHIGKFRQSLRTRYREHTNFIAFDVRQHVRQVARIKIYLPAKDIIQCERSTFIRHHRCLYAGTMEKQQCRQMGQSAYASISDIQHIWILSTEVDELRERLEGTCPTRGDYKRIAANVY